MKKRLLSNSVPFYILGITSLLVSASWYAINQLVDVGVTVGIALTVILLVIGYAIDPQRVKGWLRGRQAKYGSNALVLSLAVIGIFAVINYIVYDNPKQWDLTEDQEYTLSPETRVILEELPEQVNIIGFYTPSVSAARDNIRPLLDQFQILGAGKLNYNFIDPLENPFMAEQYGVSRDASLVVAFGDSSEVVEFASEQRIAEAMIRLMNPGESQIYYLTGHSERDFESNEASGYGRVRSALEARNYAISELNLIVNAQIPADTDLLLIAAPQVQLTEGEVELVKEYLAAGGSLIVLSEPGLNIEGEEDLLEDYLTTDWGIELRNDFVVDLTSSLRLSGISAQYAMHPITEDIQNLVTFFPSIRSIRFSEMGEGTINRVELVLTSEQSWGESDLQSFNEQGVLEYDEESDALGPLVLVATAENNVQGSRIVVFGDSDFASNGFFFELGNGDLLINSVDWAIGNDQLISLTSKPSTQRFVVPPSNQTIWIILILTLFVIPGSVIFFGVMVWWQRRNTR